MQPAYIRNFIEEPTATFDRLMAEVEWVQREGTPRMEYWHTLKNQPYTYGQGRGERTYYPQPLTPTIKAIRQKVLEKLDYWLEGCFMNYYADGSKALGWHADDDPGIDHTKPIVVISLGGMRYIHWREIGAKGEESIHKELLGAGSAFIMPAGMQQTHYHRIPKSEHLNTPRMSLTFRGLL